MQPPQQPPDDKQEPAELAQFRNAWKAEVQRKRAAQNVQSNISKTPHDGSAHPLPKPPSSDDRTLEESPLRFTEARRDNLRLSEVPFRPHVASDVEHEFTPSLSNEPTDTASIPTSYGRLNSSLDVYHRAVQHEQRSELDEALQLYRQAFRMDPNVDKAYHKAQTQAQPLYTQREVSPHVHHRKSLPVSAHIPNEEQALTAVFVVTGTLASLLASFPDELGFEPDDEERKLALTKLPDELLVHVLLGLDHTAIERFAAVNRKARVVSLDSAIWRGFVRETYKPPQVPDEKYMDAVVRRYQYDYRRAFVEHPRLRLDGVYIAVCHYVRAGMSQNAWANLTHLITYHRYLRFFPNGQVLSLLANEELGPQQAIPLLKPTLRMKGLTVGNWRLDDTTVYVTDLVDPSLQEPTHHAASSKRFAFQMTLSLRSRPLGRWNKLDFAAYETVNVETGEADPLSLRHERPFWFSKVRSYASY